MFSCFLIEIRLNKFYQFFRWNHTPLSEAVDHVHPHIEEYLKNFMREKTYLEIGGNPYEVEYDHGVTTRDVNGIFREIPGSKNPGTKNPGILNPETTQDKKSRD